MQNLGKSDFSFLLHQNINRQILNHKLRQTRGNAAAKNNRNIWISFFTKKRNPLKPSILGNDAAKSDNVRFRFLKLLDNSGLYFLNINFQIILDRAFSFGVKV